MKAIKTTYLGTVYRSRIEARWAIFLDEMGINFEYEKEGFELKDGTPYLPDFYLPEENYYLEIKGTKYSDKESSKASLLAEESETVVFILFGGIPNYRKIKDHCHCFKPNFWDNNYLWCKCPCCGKLGLEFEGRSNRLSCECISVKHRDVHKDILAALDKARSYKFNIGSV